MKRFLFLFVFLVFVISCNKDDDKFKEKDIKLSNLNFTDCVKSNESISSSNSCITIKSDGNNNLTFTHKGAEFCCETEDIEISFAVNGDSLIIQEIDNGPFSYCFCEHDISFNIGPLDYGYYKVKINESENSYNRDTLTVELNHTSNTNYSNCN